MNHKDVRKGIVQANFNQKFKNVVAIEAVVFSIIIGFVLQSWWAFGISFFLFFILMQIRTLFLILMGLCWGFVGFAIGKGFDSPLIPYGLGVLFFVVGYYINHFSAIYYDDTYDGND